MPRYYSLNRDEVTEVELLLSADPLVNVPKMYKEFLRPLFSVRGYFAPGFAGQRAITSGTAVAACGAVERRACAGPLHPTPALLHWQEAQL
jgi:hypothetical protein